jgi:uncharacterized tellurite resistance protein B-like protein
MADRPNASDYDILDEVLRQNNGAALPREVAFLTILMGAIYADNRERKVETQEADALISRVRTLQTIPVDDREKRREEVTPLVRDERTRADRVKIACESVLQAQAGSPPTTPEAPGLAESVFAHACDVIYTDLEVTDSEMNFIKTIAKNLRVSPDRASLILQAIAAKNRY